jgi:hypothetical protein
MCFTPGIAKLGDVAAIVADVVPKPVEMASSLASAFKVELSPALLTGLSRIAGMAPWLDIVFEVNRQHRCPLRRERGSDVPFRHRQYRHYRSYDHHSAQQSQG